jgi:RNA-directed DNA polymerase
VCHGRRETESQAQQLATAIGTRMAEVGLRLHPTKTRIVYCKDGRRRLARTRTGVNFTGFLPAISKHALHRMSRQVRRWRLHLLTGHTPAELARKVNPVVRGWMQ